ncbi:hypothetical protein ACGFIG_19750 [Micromonospora sp. NPDC049048]|uniref:hypothetical protein n=1 Tax=Micromonospora sp. NPDC049048 TaxID=3364263 RepID=UPI0037104939
MPLAAPPTAQVMNPGRLAVGQMVVVGVAAALFLRVPTSSPWWVRITSGASIALFVVVTTVLRVLD